jgi:hypothetical protein
VRAEGRSCLRSPWPTTCARRRATPPPSS